MDGNDRTLKDLCEKAMERFNALSPEEQAEHRRQQAISFVFGNCALSNEDVTREMCEDIVDESIAQKKAKP